MVMSTAKASFVRTGRLGLPRIGAVAINASIRLSGHIIAVIRAYSSAVVMLIIRGVEWV